MLYAAAARIPFIPVIVTASELMRGLEHGHTRFKFFPADAAGGTTALRAFAGPFPQTRFCPSGGIYADKARDWDRIAALAGIAAKLRGDD